MSNNSDQIQPQFVTPLINDVTSKHLQYSHNNIHSYPTYPLNVHLPATSPSTNRNMPTYYQPYITVPHTSFGSTLTPSTSTHRDSNMQHTPHTLSSAPTLEPPVKPTDSTNAVLNSELVNPFYENYYSENTN